MKTATTAFGATAFKMSNGWFARSEPSQRIPWRLANAPEFPTLADGATVQIRPAGFGNAAIIMEVVQASGS